MQEEPYTGLEVFFVAHAIRDGFHVGFGQYFTDGSKLYPDPRRREIGWGFCPVDGRMQLRTTVFGQVSLENASVLVADLLAVTFLIELSVGRLLIHSNCNYVCAGWRRLEHRTRRGAHVSLWTRLQHAVSQHQGSVEMFLGVTPTSPQRIIISLHLRLRLWLATHLRRKVRALSW